MARQRRAPKKNDLGCLGSIVAVLGLIGGCSPRTHVEPARPNTTAATPSPASQPTRALRFERSALTIDAKAEPPDFAQVKRLSCVFDGGTLLEWDNGEAQGKLLSDSMVFSFELDGDEARLTGNSGSAPVFLQRRGRDLFFLEETPSGNHMSTTVFATRTARENEFPAVMSRHLSILGRPLASTYLGKCIVTWGDETP